METKQHTLNKTVVFNLKSPTARKRERIDAAMEEAGRIVSETSDRMASVPKRYWGTAQPKNSVWYAWAKELDSFLSNKDIHENIQRVRETYASYQGSGYEGEEPNIREDGIISFYYEKPKYKTDGESYYVTLPFAAGRGEREVLPIRDGDYLREFVDKILDGELQKGRAELISDGDEYKLHQVIREDIEAIARPKVVVGVDMGLVNIATAGAYHRTSGEKLGAELWSGAEAADRRDRFYQARKSAQEEGRKEHIRDVEHRYIEHVCHNIAREVVEWAATFDRPKIAAEDLTHIRDDFIRREREYTDDMKRALHSWQFRKLQDMIGYKAAEEGIPFEKVDPNLTSQICNECESEETHRERANFECNECGYQVNADVNGAFNIAQRGV